MFDLHIFVHKIWHIVLYINYIAYTFVDISNR